MGSDDEGRERRLRDVLRLLGIEACTARNAEDLSEIGLADGLDGGLVARPHPYREVWDPQVAGALYLNAWPGLGLLALPRGVITPALVALTC